MFCTKVAKGGGRICRSLRYIYIQKVKIRHMYTMYAYSNERVKEKTNSTLPIGVASRNYKNIPTSTLHPYMHEPHTHWPYHHCTQYPASCASIDSNPSPHPQHPPPPPLYLWYKGATLDHQHTEDLYIYMFTVACASPCGWQSFCHAHTRKSRDDNVNEHVHVHVASRGGTHVGHKKIKPWSWSMKACW